MKAKITPKGRIHGNKCRPGTVEWSSQKTFDKCVQKFRQTSAAGSHMGSWEIDTCQSLTPFQVSTGYPRSTEKDYKPCWQCLSLDHQEMFKDLLKKKKKKGFNVFDIPDWCWAWPGPPAEYKPMHHVHSTTCATPEGKLWATYCCFLQVLTVAHLQKACFSQPTCSYKFLPQVELYIPKNVTFYRR